MTNITKKPKGALKPDFMKKKNRDPIELDPPEEEDPAPTIKFGGPKQLKPTLVEKRIIKPDLKPRHPIELPDDESENGSARPPPKPFVNPIKQKEKEIHEYRKKVAEGPA